MTLRGRNKRFAKLVVALMVVPVLFANMGGCPDFCDQFVNASADAIQQGVTTILAGITAGVFAVATQRTTTVSSTSTTSYTQGGDPNSTK